MGCDIHMHIEVRDGARWQHVAAPRVIRNYTLFALLADCGREPMVRPVAGDNRGVPKDAHFETRWMWNYEHRDCHSASWVSWDEFMVVRERLKAEDGQDALVYFENADFTNFDFSSIDVANARFVFWFDN